MAPVVQQPAPSFKKTAVVDGVFEEVTLEQYKGKWVLLAFIPLAFTFVCPSEIIAYSEAVKKFAEKDAQVLFASTDSNTPGWLGPMSPEKTVVLAKSTSQSWLTPTTPCPETTVS